MKVKKAYNIFEITCTVLPCRLIYTAQALFSSILAVSLPNTTTSQINVNFFH